MIENDICLCEIIAERVNKIGGKAYYVGGFVRDFLMGVESTDIDIEIHGVSYDEVKKILSDVCVFNEVGASFGVFKINNRNIDVALPRKEKCTGSGHRDFAIEVDPFLGEEKASSRRDFTVNAMMKNVISGEILDFFGGKDDLKNKIIRHVNDDKFSEDALRVLRACMFASRFSFDIADETMTLCRKIDISTLAKERVYCETEKALLKSKNPSVFFEKLFEMGKGSVWFPELFDLKGVLQSEIYHPEGDAFVHTMKVIDEAAKFIDFAENKIGFMLSALCHDFGKKITTETIDGKIHSYNHETKGIPVVKKFLNRITSERELIKYILNMVENHMKPNSYLNRNSSQKAWNRLFDVSVSPNDLLYLSCADRMGNEDEGLTKKKREFLENFKILMSKPYVRGSDLIESGIKPDKNFGEILDYSHKLRLAGVPKNEALIQTIAFAKTKK